MPDSNTPRRGRRTPAQFRRLKIALAMRDEGRSWSEIGDRLKISRQAAYQLVKKYRQASAGGS